MSNIPTFDELVLQAAGHPPYPYQCRLAEEGLPELLRVPTGTGKTLAATLPWLYRRRFHPDPAVRGATPRWLVLVLPMRVLVEQTLSVVSGWMAAVGLEEHVAVHTVMGGEGRLESRWRRSPEQDAIFVGTLDMLVSRALNRGYGASRFVWPIDFGLFNAGCQWVFDEVQLMGPALPTSLQLDGLRRSLGTAMLCSSMWMSATVEDRWLATIDHPSIDSVAELGDDDRAGHLARRLKAEKTVRRLEVDPDPKRYAASLAAHLLELHQPGTRTIAVLNTVERARQLRLELERAGAPDLVLLHSRFRPDDRARRTIDALAEVDARGPGRIVVSTQVLEAGVDLSSSLLFTEAAPWPSVVQRAGRCNRDGDAPGATLAWSPPPKAAPYEEADVAAAAAELITLESQALTATEMGARSVAVAEVVHPLLRRRDLLGLFDTTPDLSGNDVDVARFIRSVDDIDLLVAWRPVTEAGPDDTDPTPTREELCPVPIGELRTLLKKGRAAWRFDHLREGWARCGPGDVRPGQVVVLRSAEGGYEPRSGWDPLSRTPVPPVRGDEPAPGGEVEEGTGADPLTFAPGTWVPLTQHLAEVEAAVRELYAELAPPGLSSGHGEAAAGAGRLHDLGKAHPCFQQMLLATVRYDHERPPDPGPAWAKSGGSGRSHHQRRYFRHELASALALLGGASPALDGLDEPDLAVFLVAAHHGKVRVGIRSLPEEPAPPDPTKRFALGVWDGDVLPEVDIPGQRLPAAVLDLGPMELGDQDDGRPSWSGTVLELRDRADLGPFRLAFLEAVVRLADWRMSAAHEDRTR